MAKPEADGGPNELARGSKTTRLDGRERIGPCVTDAGGLLRDEGGDAHPQRWQAVGMLALLGLSGGRDDVVVDAERGDRDVLLEKLAAEEPHRVLVLKVAPRRDHDILVAHAADDVERRQRQRRRLEVVSIRHCLDGARVDETAGQRDREMLADHHRRRRTSPPALDRIHRELVGGARRYWTCSRLCRLCPQGRLR